MAQAPKRQKRDKMKQGILHIKIDITKVRFFKIIDIPTICGNNLLPIIGFVLINIVKTLDNPYAVFRRVTTDCF